jgi:hypothetical protein
MTKHGFMPSSPLHCVTNGSGKLKIIRGHHRFDCAKRLGLPVYFIVDKSNTNIFDLEGSSYQQWSGHDFTVARARAGDKNCQEVLAFTEAHGLNIAISASLLGGESAGSGNMIRSIKEGVFRLRKTTHPDDVVAITDLCRTLNVSFATSSSFVAAVSMALRIPELDADQLRRRIKSRHKNMNRRSTRVDYLEELEAIYNYGSRGALLALKLRAVEIARELAASTQKNKPA